MVTKMKTKLSLTAVVLFGALALAPVRVGNAQEPTATPSLTTFTINDPSLGGMKAFSVTVPSAWQFQGSITPSLPCTSPSPVFRAYSPDGLTEIRLMPFFQWQIWKQTRSDGQVLSALIFGCIQMDKTLTAAEFLNQYAQAIEAHVVGPMSVGTTYQQQFDSLLSQMNANGSKLGNTTQGDIAALRVEVANGTFTIEQRLRARVFCTLWSKPIANVAGNCIARVDVLRAPKGQLDALADLDNRHNLATAKNDDAWGSAAIAHMQEEWKKVDFDPPHQNHAALALAYRQAQDFGLTGERPHDLKGSLEAVYVPMAQRRVMRLRPDWADFALDILPNPADSADGMRLPSKMHTWSSATGQLYRTANPNTNPNGVLAGTWTEVPTVRDNSQPQ
jgi:hypothetical protein